MIKTTLKIEGMACGMCESHVNDAIRRSFKVSSVTSSHKKGITEIVSEEPVERDKAETVIKDMGYTLTGYESEPYEKKGFSLFRKK